MSDSETMVIDSHNEGESSEALLKRAQLILNSMSSAPRGPLFQLVSDVQELLTRNQQLERDLESNSSGMDGQLKLMELNKNLIEITRLFRELDGY